MSRRHLFRYNAPKALPEARTEDSIKSAIEEHARDGALGCRAAHAVARALGVTPLQVGNVASSRTTIRFSRCQLGLFGYGPKSEGKSKIVLPATNLPADLVAAVCAAATNGRISCAAAWQIADEHDYPRLGIANVIEALGLKVAPCQLGCF